MINYSALLDYVMWRNTKKMIKVVKFGGSSLASAAQFKKVGAIIRKEETRRYVVPSAPGKRHSGDTKVTDLLYKCYGQAILDDDREEDMILLLMDWSLRSLWTMNLRRSGKISAKRSGEITLLPEENI